MTMMADGFTEKAVESWKHSCLSSRIKYR